MPGTLRSSASRAAQTGSSLESSAQEPRVLPVTPRGSAVAMAGGMDSSEFSRESIKCSSDPEDTRALGLPVEVDAPGAAVAGASVDASVC